jgi:hypothetical protein
VFSDFLAYTDIDAVDSKVGVVIGDVIDEYIHLC